MGDEYHILLDCPKENNICTMIFIVIDRVCINVYNTTHAIMIILTVKKLRLCILLENLLTL